MKKHLSFLFSILIFSGFSFAQADTTRILRKADEIFSRADTASGNFTFDDIGQAFNPELFYYQSNERYLLKSSSWANGLCNPVKELEPDRTHISKMVLWFGD